MMDTKNIALCLCTTLLILSWTYIYGTIENLQMIMVPGTTTQNESLVETLVTLPPKPQVITKVIECNRSNDDDNSIESLIRWSIRPKQFCFGNFESSVAMVSMGDITNLKFNDLIELSRLNKGYYAMKYNYVFCEFPSNPEIGRSPIYGRAAILLNALKLYKFVVWIDFDVVAHINTRNVDHIINHFYRNDNINIIFTTDLNGKPNQKVERGKNFKDRIEDTIQVPPHSEPEYFTSVNSAIIFTKSSNYTMNFIKEWHSYFKIAEDQQALHWHYYEHQDEWKQYIKTIAYQDIEDFVGMKEDEKKQTDGDLAKSSNNLWHIAGGHWQWEKKQERLRDIILKYMNQTVLERYRQYKHNMHY